MENREFQAVAVGDNLENDDRIVWNSLCLRGDRDAIVYLTTFFLIASVVAFCFYQLIHLTSCSDQQAYLGVLGMILGVLLPSPSISKKK